MSLIHQCQKSVFTPQYFVTKCSIFHLAHSVCNATDYQAFTEGTHRFLFPFQKFAIVLTKESMAHSQEDGTQGHPSTLLKNQDYWR